MDSAVSLLPERCASLFNSPPASSSISEEFEEAFDIILDGRSTSLPNSRGLGWLFWSSRLLCQSTIYLVFSYNYHLRVINRGADNS